MTAMTDRDDMVPPRARTMVPPTHGAQSHYVQVANQNA